MEHFKKIGYKNIYRVTYILTIIAPAVSLELLSHNSNSLHEFWKTFLDLLGGVCLAFNFMITFTQLTASFDWLYSKNSIFSIKPLYLLYTDSKNNKNTPSYKERAVHTLLGFLLYLILIANLYQYISFKDNTSFNIDMHFFDSFYFTTVTSATVGFGDICPQSILAKSIVTIQIWTTFFYAIGIFSSLPSILSKLDDEH